MTHFTSPTSLGRGFANLILAVEGIANEQTGRICGHFEDESDVLGPRDRRTAADFEPLPHPASGGGRGLVPERRSGRGAVWGSPWPDPHRDRRCRRQSADAEFH